MTDAPDPAAALRLALADEPDLDGAMAAGRRLSQTTLPDLLGDLATALKEGRDRDAETLFRTLVDRYEGEQIEERSRLVRFRTAIAGPGVGYGASQRLQEYMRTAATADAKRVQTMADVGGFLEDQTSENAPSRSEAVTTVRETRSLEQALTEDLTGASAVADTVSLPPKLALVALDASGGLAVDTTGQVTVAVRNVGDEAVTEVSLSLSAREGLLPGTDAVSLGRLAADQTTERTVELEATATGEHLLEATAEGRTAAPASRSVLVSVTDSADSPSPTPSNPYDTNGDGTIQAREVLGVIAAFNDGTISDPAAVLAVIREFNDDQNWADVGADLPA